MFKNQYAKTIASDYLERYSWNADSLALIPSSPAFDEIIDECNRLEFLTEIWLVISEQLEIRYKNMH